MRRLAAALGALGLVALVAVWAGLAVMALAYRIDDYCEDAAVCTDAAPVRACAQALIAVVGVVASVRLARSGFMYVVTGEPPEDARRWVVPAAASLVLWLTVAATLRL